MKFLTFTASLFLCTQAFAYDLSQILQRPLIAGASVSADWGATSPGKRLARKYSRNIKTVASPGSSGAAMWSSISRSIEGKTAIIALDLFFWDSRRKSVDASTQVLQSLLREASARNIPVVLGDIPELFKDSQPGRAAMNSQIRAKCAAYKHCRIFSLDSLYRQISRDGGMKIGGRFYSRSELLPDGLHPGEVASQEMSNRLAQLLSR